MMRHIPDLVGAFIGGVFVTILTIAVMLYLESR